MRKYEEIIIEMLDIDCVDIIATSTPKAPADNGFNGKDDKEGWGLL